MALPIAPILLGASAGLALGRLSAPKETPSLLSPGQTTQLSTAAVVAGGLVVVAVGALLVFGGSR